LSKECDRTLIRESNDPVVMALIWREVYSSIEKQGEQKCEFPQGVAPPNVTHCGVRARTIPRFDDKWVSRPHEVGCRPRHLCRCGEYLDAIVMSPSAKDGSTAETDFSSNKKTMISEKICFDPGLYRGHVARREARTRIDSSELRTFVVEAQGHTLLSRVVDFKVLNDVSLRSTAIKIDMHCGFELRSRQAAAME
jgi:hypothetical protein